MKRRDKKFECNEKDFVRFLYRLRGYEPPKIIKQHKRIKPERTGWRDENISRWHRNWDNLDANKRLPLMDIDTVYIESCECKPIALVEWIHTNISMKKINENKYKVLPTTNLANMASLPAFLIRYDIDIDFDIAEFIVYPLNPKAKKFMRLNCE